jgi:Helix-turn-helix of DDE superfamily endonuclease
MTPQSNRWEHVRNLPDTQFRRLTGVKPATFALMVQVVNAAEQTKKKSGKPHKLTPEDRVLLSLEYLRDYPTYLRLSVNWGVHESTAKRINNRVEDILIKDPRFHVSGKKALLENPNLEVVIVDASERPIERPKKSSDGITAVRRNSTRSKSSW